jgi:hypothetical protein
VCERAIVIRALHGISLCLAFVRQRASVQEMGARFVRRLPASATRRDGSMAAHSSLMPRPRTEQHEALIRSVVDFAHEVRIQLYDERVIFGSVSSKRNEAIGSFRIRPWGQTEPKAIKFSDVSVAAPVKHMVWERYRSIVEAQKAGIFAVARGANR